MSSGDESSIKLVRACGTGELSPGEAVRVPVNPPIAVFNVDGEFYATADWCTHEEASLAEDGIIEGDRVKCSWHGAQFCITTGAVEGPPATEPLTCYEVRVSDGDVYVVVPVAGG